MTKDEHNTLLTELRTCTDDARRIALITSLETDYTGVLAERDTATENEQKATEQAKTYQEVNNNLWLQVSGKNTQQSINDTTLSNNDTENNEQPQKLSFADLEAKILNEYKGVK